MSLGSLPGMEDRCVTLSGLGKTYAVTGWRVGWAVAAAPLTALDPQGARLRDDLRAGALPGGGPHGARAARTPTTTDLRRDYAARRDILLPALTRAGLDYTAPQGSYYVMVDAARARLEGRLGARRFPRAPGRRPRRAGLLLLRARRREDARPRQLREEGGDAARGRAAARRRGPARQGITAEGGRSLPLIAASSVPPEASPSPQPSPRGGEGKDGLPSPLPSALCPPGRGRDMRESPRWSRPRSRCRRFSSSSSTSSA